MNKFRQITASLILIFLCPVAMQGQTWQWAQKAGGHHNEFGGGIDIDATGNSYVTAKFYDSISFGAITLSTPGLWSVYIAKYDVNGIVQWAKVAASSSANINVNGICNDNFGHISITGLFLDSASFGNAIPVNLYSVADYDVFLASYTSTGDLIWARSAGELGYDYGSNVSPDARGNLYITGEFHISSYSGSAAKVFVAKYDSSGNNVWLNKAEQYGNFHQGNDIKTAPDGTSYVTGQFFDTLHFDTTAVLGAGNIEANIFILKMSDSGTVIWMQKGGAPTGYTSGNAIDIDAAGNVYITGFYRGTISLGTFNLVGPGGISYDVYIAKCDSNGNYVRVNKAKGPWDLDNGVRICTDKMGSVYIAGNFMDSMTFDNNTVYSQGQPNIFIARADSLLNFNWATECGGPGFDEISGIRANALGLFLTGDFKGTGVFGPSLSLMGDSSDIFVARIYGIDTVEAVANVSNMPGVKLFPNPAGDEIQISGVSNGTIYTIYDISGRIIMTGNTGTANKISVSGLEQGMYFIRFTEKGNAGRAQTLRFIKS